ncbi:ParB-like chromosome segregation protein Spo0J [Saccharothrix ecbatanensis]|uniref:ParB-like chromosome segregation protein Spo0J n=1 Tax=Saccharothrix ecbatanensis TaxID=1105145 RepID=A0A7W9M1N4_9PSEU|nr:ParB/RepB/Spo0J family partition protein [Saccharothrix ecbatanensis]MBB5804086.1 ParB-like chromosome segregation protein Spo0J [Saccharothrix ecbatanensis]
MDTRCRDAHPALPSLGRPPGHPPAESVSIDALHPSDSPRTSGENSAHARTLAESGAELPPILVHRATMRVIDGMHRLRAAELRGEKTVLVRYFDGAATEAFVLGVKANITHGLPLSLADRRVAAERIIESHPQWSDRAIASVTGLAAKTVGMIRRCASEDSPQLRARIGRDGRVRPLSSAAGRLQACVMLQENPAASLRQIASASGISLGTVRDVRDRLARGEDPVPSRQRPRSEVVRSASVDVLPERTDDQMSRLLVRLRQDPSIRLTESGRALIRLLSVHALTAEERRRLLNTVPEHCRGVVAELANACAQTWCELATWLARGAEAKV